MITEPTEDMLIAARDWSANKYGKPIGNDAAIGCWKAMAAAAPLPTPPVETWAVEEYREGVGAHAACRQLIRSLGCAGFYPTLKRMLEDLLSDANRSSHEHAMTKDALRTVVQSVPKN